MDKKEKQLKNQVIDITKIVEKTNVEEEAQTTVKVEKATNPIQTSTLKKLAQFKHTQLSKKFDINDLLR